MYYGLRIGLTYDESLEIPLPLLLDLIACQQIKCEGFEPKAIDEDNIMAILSVR